MTDSGLPLTLAVAMNVLQDLALARPAVPSPKNRQPTPTRSVTRPLTNPQPTSGVGSARGMNSIGSSVVSARNPTLGGVQKFASVRCDHALKKSDHRLSVTARRHARWHGSSAPADILPDPAP